MRYGRKYDLKDAPKPGADKVFFKGFINGFLITGAIVSIAVLLFIVFRR